MHPWSGWIRFALCGGIVALSVALGVPDGHAASDEQRAAARSLAEQGAHAFSERRFGDAVDRFERAQALIHSPVHLLFIARASVELGLLVKAQETYIKITRENLASGAPPAFVNAVEQAHGELEVLKPRIPRVTVSIDAPAGASPELFIDGTPVPNVMVGVPLPLDPGQHTFEVRAEGASPVQKELSLVEGQSAELELALGPSVAAAQPAPEGGTPVESSVSTSDLGENDLMRYGAYVGFGVGVVGIGVGTVFLLSAQTARDEADELFNACNPGCSTDEQDRVQAGYDDQAKNNTIALVSYVGAGVGIAAGVALLLLSTNDDGGEAATQPRIVPYFGGTSLGVAGTF